MPAWQGVLLLLNQALSPLRRDTGAIRVRNSNDFQGRFNPECDLLKFVIGCVAMNREHLTSSPVWADQSALLGSAVRHVATLSPHFDWVGIYLLNGKSLELGPYIGAPTDHTKIEVGVGVCGTAVAEGRDQNVPDVRSRENYLACSLETRSELVVLIRDADDRIVGQIDIDSHTVNAFGPDEERAVKKVAEELGKLWPRRASLKQH
jgi:L-methionine (R)-S-oxide reductase